jgi:hypothetical protein
VSGPTRAETFALAFHAAALELVRAVADGELPRDLARTAMLDALSVQAMVAPLVDVGALAFEVGQRIDADPPRRVSAGPPAVSAGEDKRRRMSAVVDQAVTRNVICQMDDGVCVTPWHRHPLDDAITDARSAGRCTATLTDPDGQVTGVCGGWLDAHGRCDYAVNHIRPGGAR